LCTATIEVPYTESRAIASTSSHDLRDVQGCSDTSTPVSKTWPLNLATPRSRSALEKG
jgi:hypothetical protein